MMIVKAMGISTPPAKTLKRAQHDHLTEIRGGCAGDRKEQEQNGVGEKITPHREDAGEPARQRNDDDLGDEIGRRNSTAVVNAGADCALHVGQRRVNNLDVQHGQERAEIRPQYREPCLQRDGSLVLVPGKPFDNAS
jgi:hypothetical protein